MNASPVSTSVSVEVWVFVTNIRQIILEIAKNSNAALDLSRDMYLNLQTFKTFNFNYAEHAWFMWRNFKHFMTKNHEETWSFLKTVHRRFVYSWPKILSVLHVFITGPLKPLFPKKKKKKKKKKFRFIFSVLLKTAPCISSKL